MTRRLLTVLVLLAACQRAPVAPPVVATQGGPATPVDSAPPAVPLPWPATQTEPAAHEPLGVVLARLRTLATPQGLAQLPEYLTPGALEHLRDARGQLAVMPVSLAAQLAGPFDAVQVDGGRVALTSHQKGFARTAWFYLQGGAWHWDAANTAALHPADP
jgi:hypothetical protein